MTDNADPIAEKLDHIAELPLAQRAAAFLELHVQLSAELEQADAAHA